MSTGAGDKLARGMSKATFPPAGGNVTQEKWDKMFEKDDETTQHDSDTNSETTGVLGADVRETESGTGS